MTHRAFASKQHMVESLLKQGNYLYYMTSSSFWFVYSLDYPHTYFYVVYFNQ